MNVQENQVGLILNGTNNMLVYANDVNLSGNNINIINKNTDILIYSSQLDDLDVNAEKTRYMLLSHHQNTGHMKI
jgi:hypothetical protein